MWEEKTIKRSVSIGELAVSLVSITKQLIKYKEMKVLSQKERTVAANGSEAEIKSSAYTNSANKNPTDNSPMECKRHRKSFASLCPLLFLIGAVMLGGVFYGCQERKSAMSTSDVDVYVVGVENNTAVLLKNGIKQVLDGGTFAYSVYVSNDDVYVAGYLVNADSTTVARLWKNGVLQTLEDAEGTQSHSVCVANNNDVYVAGFTGTSAILWKNGIRQTLETGQDYYTESVYVYENDVYVAGTGNGQAILWKNGTSQILNDGYGAGSVYVNSDDIYVAGSGYESAILWKNNSKQTLEDSSKCGYAVYVMNDDVYVTGSGREGAILWKNGTKQTLEGGDKEGDYAYSIYGFDNDVYVTGWTQENGAVLWKNGIKQVLTDVDYVAGVFVVSH